MKATPPTCPDHATLVRLIDNKLAKAARAELVAHVTKCDSCRAALKKLMPGKSKSDVSKTEPDVPPPSGRVPKKSSAQAVDEDSGPTRTLHPEGTPHQSDATDLLLDDWQTHLAPSKKTGSLGKLGHYEVLRLIGRGGMGVVLEGFDEKLQRVVAIKLLAPALAGSTTARKRFVREARAAAAVRNSHVVNIYEVDESGPIPFLVIEFIAGGSLESRLRRDEAMDVKEIVTIGIQIADGLGAAHKQGLVHRDIKPANILLEKDTSRVIITDFGLARAVDDANLTQSGVISGTPMYMAPEQALGQSVDQRADLFSLGCVLYAMCTGQSPFKATGSMAVIRRVCDEPHKSVQELNALVPEWLCEVIDKLLAKNRDERFNSTQEVADQLRRHVFKATGQRRSAPAEDVTQSVQMPAPVVHRRKSRWPLYVALAAVACLLLSLTALLPLYLRNRSSSGANIAQVPKAVSAEAAPTNERFKEKSPPFKPLPLPPFKRENIPTRFLEIAGGGRADRAPPDIVAVFGEDNWLLPVGARGSWIDLSPDGLLLAVPSNDSVAILDAETGKWLNTLTGFRGRASSVAFSPSGKQIAVGTVDGDNAIHLYNVSNGRQLRTFQSSWPVLRLAFCPADSRLLAAVGGIADKTGGVAVWNVSTGNMATELSDLSAVTRNAVFAPDGAWLATASDDEKIRIWNGRNGQWLQSMKFLQKGAAYGLAFSSDGKFLAGGNDQQTMVWATDSWAPIAEKPWNICGEWLAFKGQSHKLLAAAHENKAFRPVGNTFLQVALPYAILDLETKYEIQTPNQVAVGRHVVYRLHPKGDRLFFMTSDPQVEAIRAGRIVEPDGRLGPQPDVADPVEGLALSNDGRWMAVFNKLGDGRIWDLKSGQLAVSLIKHSGLTSHATFSPDGTRLATSAANKIRIWNTRTGELERELLGARTTSPVSFSPDGKILYAPGIDSGPKRWNVSDGQMLKEPWGQGVNLVTWVAASPDGEWVATAGTDKQVRVLSARTGAVLQAYTVDAAPAFLAFSLDGKTLVCGYVFQGARHYLMWGVPDWRPLPAPEPIHFGTGLGFAVHPTRRTVACALTDGSVQLTQRVEERDQVNVFDAGLFGHAVKCFAFTPDGSCLAVGAQNGTVVFMQVPEVLEKPTSAVTGELFAKASSVPGWGTITDPNGDCPVRFDGSNLSITVPKKGPHLLGQAKQKLSAPRLLQSLEGDFTAEVRVQAFPPPLASTALAKSGGPIVSAGLLISQDDKNFIRWERAVVDGTSLRLRLERIVSGISSYRQEWDISEPNTSLLVERVGNIFTFKIKVSPAAIVWSDRYFTTWVMSPKLKVGVFAINNTTKDLTANLQGFKLSTGGPNQNVAATGNYSNGKVISQYGTVVDTDGDCRFMVDKGGALTINVPNAPHDLVHTPDRPMQNAPRVLKNLIGDFVVSTTIFPFSKLGDKKSSTGGPGILAAGLLIWQDDKNFIRWERVSIDGKAERLQLEHYEAGSKKLDKTFDSDGGVILLQVERSGDQVLFRGGRPVGTNAKLLHVAKLELPARLRIGVHAINTAGVDFSPRFQFFNAFSETVVPRKVASFSPAPPGTFPLLPVPEKFELAKKPAPADAFKHSDIPNKLLAKLGTGKNDAPKELVAVLGNAGDPQVVSLSLAAVGSRLAVCRSRGSSAHLFDLTNGRFLKSIGGNSTPVDIVSMSGDGKTLAMTGATARTVQVFDMATGRSRTTLSSVIGNVLEAVFSSDGKHLAIGDSGGNLKVFDAESGIEHAVKLTLTKINRMAFSPDSKFVACSGLAGKDHPVVIVEVATLKVFGPLIGHTNTVLGLAWHPSGQKLGSVDNSGWLRVWDLSTMAEAQPAWKSEGFPLHGLAWHPSGEFLASSNHVGGTITLWDMRGPTARQHQEIRLFPPDALSKESAKYNNDLLFTPEGRYLVAGNSDGTISVLRLPELAGR